MGVVNNEIRIAGIEANTAGIMTSVASMRASIKEITPKANNSISWDDADGYISKNLLPNVAVSGSDAGITYTVNADKTVSIAAGTSTGNSFLQLAENFTLPTGTYILSGTNDKMTHQGFYIQLRSPSAGIDYHINEDAQFTLASDTLFTYCRIAIIGAQEVPANVVKPMIRKASILNSKYEAPLIRNDTLGSAKLDTATLKSVTAAAEDFAAFKTAVAAL